jgi:hypothetical protein
VVVVVAVGAIAFGLASIIHRPAIAAWVVVLVVVIAASIIVLGIRDRNRGCSIDKMIEAANPLLGATSPTRDLVIPSRWKGGWIGTPERLELHYAATVFDGDPKFVETLVVQISRRMDVPYKVRKNVPRKCLIYLERDHSTPEAEVSSEIAHATRVARNVLGASASVECETDETGAVTAVTAKYDLDSRDAMASYRQRIDKVFSSKVPGRWRSFWRLEQDEVRFEIRPTMPTMIPHLAGGPRPQLTHASYDACKIAYCVDEDGVTQYWQPSVSPHMLIIGGTGSGKTSLEHTILTDVSLFGWRVWVLDGKRIEFSGFRDWPNVELVASSVGDQVRMIHAAHDLMEQRYALIESGKARISDFEPLLLIIDEFATFRGRVQRWYKTVKPKGYPTQAPVFELIEDLARLARTAKIHMAIGIQRPDVTFLGGEMRDNFGARASLGRISPQGANMMWDSFAIGVAIPRKLRGRGISLNDDSQPVEVQTFYTPDPAKLTDDKVDEWAHLNQLRPAETTYPRKMILPPRPSVDIDGKDDIAEPSYSDWETAAIVAYDPARTGQSEIETVEPSPASSIGVHFEPVEDVEPADRGSSGDDLFEGYDEADAVKVNDLDAGDLVLVDESLALWGVVEEVTPDVFTDGYVSIDYRDLETGEPNTVSVPDDEAVTARRPFPDEDAAAARRSSTK